MSNKVCLALAGLIILGVAGLTIPEMARAQRTKQRMAEANKPKLETTEVGVPYYNTTLQTATHKNHQYVVALGGSGVAMIHSPECVCLKTNR